MRYGLASAMARARESQSSGRRADFWRGTVLGGVIFLTLFACEQSPEAVVRPDAMDSSGPFTPHAGTGGGVPASMAGAGAPQGATQAPGMTDKALEDGRPLWAQLCTSCHGDFALGSTVSSGNANGDFRLDVSAAIQRHGAGLEDYIDAAMPMGAPERCDSACATTLGAYLRALATSGDVECSSGAGPAAGTRQVVLLTSREYQNALEDLLDVPTDFGKRVENNDGRKGGFVDMSAQLVSDTLLDTYQRNAEAVAKWAIANERPFACTDSALCAKRFVNEFLFEAFRGNVSDEQKAAYEALFAQYPTEGLELALKAALSSPLFLYRVEMGVDVESAYAAGHYNPAVSSSQGLGVEPSASLPSTGFAAGSSGSSSRNEWLLDMNGRIRFAFAQPLTDPAVVEIAARGTNHGATWPELTLYVNGNPAGKRRVDSATLRAYRFDVTGVQGQAMLELSFDNDSGESPYGPGQDVNVYVSEARLYNADVLATAASSNTAQPTVKGSGGLLDGATPDAFVLTPLELASTLAFRLTGSTPDRELLEAARDGRIATRQDLRAQVTRLIDSAGGREHMAEFVTRWFRLDEIDKVSRPDVPELTAEVKAAMLEEVRTHFLHVFYDDEVPYSEFFGGDYTFLNRTLAEFYGIGGGFDDSFRKTLVTGRGGPLASGAFMTVNAHAERTAPILRAVRARQTALCHYIDPPNSPIAGDDIDAQRAAAQEKVTAAEQAAGVLSSRDFYFLYTDGIDACAGCHAQIINPMFGMEDFDNVGRLRPSAGGNHVTELVRGMSTDVSTEGTLYGVASTSDPETITYAGAKDLSNKLASTEAINVCLARKAFRFVTGGAYVESDLDGSHKEMLTPEQRGQYACVADTMLQAFDRDGQSPRAMFIELATDNMLLFRR